MYPIIYGIYFKININPIIQSTIQFINIFMPLYKLCNLKLSKIYSDKINNNTKL